MRPVNRGSLPLDENGKPKQYKKYAEARNDLIGRIGNYCSYCEMPLKDSPAIEHIQPKSKNPALINEWQNFLLACSTCNGIKKDNDITIDDYFWPDIDNTAQAFVYETDRALQINSNLTLPLQKIAQNTLELTGLDREPGHPKYNIKKQDQRLKHRLTAWGIAKRSRENLQKIPADEMREQILITAIETGFFSVWMTVFQDDSDMRRRLITAFKGTCTSCFDENTQPVLKIGR